MMFPNYSMAEPFTPPSLPTAFTDYRKQMSIGISKRREKTATLLHLSFEE